MSSPFLPLTPRNLIGSAMRVLARPASEPAPRPLTSQRYLRLEPEGLVGPEPLYVTRLAYESIRLTVGARPAEQGAMLGGRRSRGVATHVHFDETAIRTGATYSPDTTTVNRLLKEEWNPSGIDLLGFVHSHPAGSARPSHGDLIYADRIITHIDAMDRMLMPIVQTRPDTGRFTLHPYIAARDPRGTTIEDVELRVVHGSPARTRYDPAFARVWDAYDLQAMAGLRLVLVGVGGAAEFAESMARAGVGEFVLIDPDIIEAPNLGTQQVYRRDIGRPKIDAVAERILDINPHAKVIGVQELLDELTDDMVRRLVHRPLPNSNVLNPQGTILCGFTDNFWAQARVNRLALHLGVPMVAAQVYAQGRAVEMSFHVPARSVACGRCVLGSRYRAHLGSATDPAVVTSHGTPLWATQRLNELKSQIVLAIAHDLIDGDPNHPGRNRYATLLERIATRNLVQVRLDPTADLPAFTKAFAGADQDRIVTDETLWLPQEPENPDTGFEPCGDCGGTGDLISVVGTIPDSHLPQPTRPARPDRPLRAAAPA
jgi:proteasome lid subunit RPN8/RPN11/uncharacterized UPF0146 family protein